MEDKFVTVSALNSYIKNLLDSDANLYKVFVKGEVTNAKPYPNGHTYFSIKDEKSVISAVIFSYTGIKLKLTNGMKVLAIGRVRVFERDGKYQLYVDSIVEEGIGELYEKYEKLKKELEASGYFNEAHKRPIVKFPKKIGVITSKTGAVREDITNIIKERYPLCEIILYPSSVQGVNAVDEIVKQIEYANSKMEVDTLIVGRGGGSLEDLWAYNEKEVALAVYNSKIPVISAVGHQTDFTICDFVSDLRAETPSSAAMLATPDIKKLKEEIIQLKNNLNNNFKSILDNKINKLHELDKIIISNSPENKLKIMNEKYNNLTKQLSKNMNLILENKALILQNLTEKNDSNMNMIYEYKRSLFEKNMAALKNLNPLAIMEKGFSIVSKDDKIVKSVKDVSKGDLIDIKLTDGNILAKVE